MKQNKLLLTGILCLIISSIYSQDFSNKGKEFWLAYSYHVGMSGGGPPAMTLYLTSDQNTTYEVEIYGGPIIQSGSIGVGQVVAVSIPNNYFINNEGLFLDRAIRVTAQKAIVVYSYITRSQASGATLCLPTTVLGKEYYSMNFTQVSNEPNSNSYFTIVGVEDNTTVEITPSANTKNGWLANTTYTVDLNKGQIYQVLGTTNGNSGVDLTGSHIKTVSSGTGGCKKIAVFSGSGKISIGCAGAGSSDNLYQQLYPVGSWGKKYLTVPSFSKPNNYYRIIKSDPAANVYVNGTFIPASSFTNGLYYQFFNSMPNSIESDLPISVSQYFTTQGCAGNGSPYDPDMIVLSPVEQNINEVTLVSSNLAHPNTNLHQHHLHVIMKNGGTGMSSFLMDGVPVPASSWTNHPTDPTYSYLYLNNVTQGYHTLKSDSGFNALAYGYADAESYGYSAGANVKDLYQFITIQNQYATVSFPAACSNAPFFFSIVLPYEPTQLQWVFGPALNAMGIADLTINNPLYDSTWTVNGRSVYRYKIQTPYVITTIGTYPITVQAQNPTGGGCSGEQEINFDLQVFDPPTAGFYFNTTGCVTSPVQFFDTTNTGGRPIIQWQWNFGDASLSPLQNPTHQYSTPGTYNVSLRVITDVGCISNPITHLVDLSTSPLAKFNNTTPTCVGKPVTFTDESTVNTGSLVEWTWDYGDGSPLDIQTTPVQRIHTYTTAGTYTASLKVKTSSGCVSVLFTKQITINVNPLPNFTIPGICLPAGTATFTNTSTISDGSTLTYLWDFGNTQTSTLQNPTTTYTSTGPFNVTLTVTSSNGCIEDTIKVVNTIYAQPDAAFTVDSLLSCFGGTLNFTDQSTAANSSITQWFWDFGDATTSTLQNPTKQYAVAGTYTVSLYTNSAAGCRSDTATMQVTILPPPIVSINVLNLLCANTPLQLSGTNSNPNGGTITQYNWTVNGTPTGGNNAVITYTAPAAGSYTVGLGVVTSNGCVGQGTNIITLNPKPLASFSLPNVCLPSGNATFINTSTISDGSALTYAWDLGNSQTSTLQNPTTTYTSTGPYNVSLTVTSSNGCVDDTIRSLNTIYAQPQAAFTTSGDVCLGGSITFTDQSNAPNSSVTQWLWNFGDATTSTLQNPVKIYSAAGTYTVTLTITSAAGCVSTVATGTVTVSQLPTADFNISSPACVTRNITFTDGSIANSGSIIEWKWDFGDGNTLTSSNGSPVTHAYATAGTYTVTLQVKTDRGCISTVLPKQVTVNILPKAGFIPPAVCLSDPAAPFIDTSSVSSGSITAWLWNFGDPNATGSNPNTSTIQNPTHAYTVVGSYTATLVVTSNQGCTDTTTRAFIVNGSVPIANFTVQNPSALCSNQDITITDASNVDFGSLIRIEIYWDYLNDPTIKTVDMNPVAGRNYTHSYPEFGTPATKTYTIRMVAYSGITCLNVTDKVVTLLATPTLQFNPIPEICSIDPAFTVNQASALNSSVIGGSGEYSGPGINAAGFFDPNISGTGAHQITYTYTGSNGCINSITQVLGVNPTPVANAGPDKFVLEGGTVVLTPALNTGFPVTYLWSPSTALNDATRPDASSSPVADITYTLTVTSDKGCATSDQVFVKVLLKPLIPNIFSPNGDGVHDKWQIDFLDTYPGCTVEIFNRYGQIVFRSVGYSTPWDGTVNGKQVPIGTYYYIVDPKNNRSKMTGYVEVIR